MGGGVAVEQFPFNYTYGGYPFGARRIPVFGPSYPGYWDDEWRSYYGNPMYHDDAVPIWLVEAPLTEDANSIAKKRKLSGLNGELASSAGHNGTRNFMKNGGSSGASSSSTKSMRSPTVSSSDLATTPARFPESSQANPTKSKRSAAASFEKRAPHSRVISIPVISGDEGGDNIVNCTVKTQEGAKESFKAPAMSAEGAVVLIQSWFRGYLVRRTAPLLQLRHIQKVKSQLKEFDEKASDAEFMKYARENSAAKVKMTESIMNLLLQLDAIQGAHPVVREFRKGATKDVIRLQGRVDALLSAEMAALEPSQLPMEIEEESRDEFDREEFTTPEFRGNDSVASAFVDADKEEEPCSTRGADSHPDQEKGEVCTVEERVEQMEYEASKPDDVDFIRSSDGFSSLMVESVPDEGNSQLGGDEGGLFESVPDEENSQVGGDERSFDQMEPEASKADVIEISQSVEDGLEGVVSQCDEPTEAHIRRESSIGNETPSDSHHEEDRENMEVGSVSAERTPEAMALTTVEADTVIISTSAERAVQSGNASDVSTHDKIETKSEGEGAELDTQINENELHSDLSEPDGGDKIHPLNVTCDCSLVDSSLPQSPTSPLEARNCMEFCPSVSDTELQSELQGSPEIMQDAPAQSKTDDETMMLKEEGERAELDVQINENEPLTASDLSEPDAGGITHPLNTKGDRSLVDSSLPYSPTSPLEARNCLDFSPSVSDGELQSELQGSPEIMRDTPAQSTTDDRTLMLKLSEENKALKSLLVTVMKWNQLQATAMQDVNHRLGKLESRIRKKKSSSRRKVGKNSKMIL